jgi:hypothetical protein
MTRHEMYRSTTLLCLAVLALPGAVWAHSDEMLDRMTAPHGGQIRMAGPLHLELVMKPGELAVYVTDHGGAEIATQGARGSATVLSGKTKTEVKLVPAAGNRLNGDGRFEPNPGMTVVVSVTMPGQPAQEARFTPLKR